jgi:hypothetical protein
MEKYAGEMTLTMDYPVFKDEATFLNPAYAPETANIDGLQATPKAWIRLFQSVIIICCFLYAFIKFRGRSKKILSHLSQCDTRIWGCYPRGD